MFKKVLLAAVVSCGLMTGSASALSVSPGIYDPGNTGTIVSKINANNALVMEKNAPTATNAAAYALVKGFGGISELGGVYEQYAPTLTALGFEVTGYCGAGSPRFNIETTDGVTHFFGCAYGTHTALLNGWQRVSFARTDGFPAVGKYDKIRSVTIIADEQGQSKLRRVNVNGQIALDPAS